MNAPPASAPPAVATRRSGRRKLLLTMVLLPIIGIAVLLAGPAEVHQVCLRTLEQRHQTSWVTGSFVLRTGPWQAIAGWPEVDQPHLRDARLRGDRSPAQDAGLVWPEGADHLWVTTRRAIPFAVVFPIENRRALPPRQRAILEVQLQARGLLDPANPADAACLRELADALLDGVVSADALDRRERRRLRDRPAAVGEQLAARLLETLAASQATPDAGRAVLCGMPD